jgi:hypothetical protein
MRLNVDPSGLKELSEVGASPPPAALMVKP